MRRYSLSSRKSRDHPVCQTALQPFCRLHPFAVFSLSYAVVIESSIAALQKEKRTKIETGGLMFAASTPRKIPTTGNRPSPLATERPRPLPRPLHRTADAYHCARGSPSLYCSRPCRSLSRRTLPHGRSSIGTKRNRRKRRAAAGTRTKRAVRERSRTSTKEGQLGE